jgi:hypothetical protein
MAAKKSSKKSKKNQPIEKGEQRVATLKLRLASPRRVPLLSLPPTFVKPKRIHPRHLLPLIKEGIERGFHSQTDETFIRPLSVVSPLAAFPTLGPLAATDQLTIVTNTELKSAAEQRTASNVGEPSAALNGSVVVYTGNWYAAISNDAGRTFQFIDPATAFPNPKPTSTFCCDQVVHYIKKIDTFVWLLQYGPRGGDNIQRLAFAKTSDVAAGKWKLFDITTNSLNVPGAFLDFPDLALSANNLYVTTNIFGPGNKFGSAVVRIPFSSIASGQVTAQSFVSFNFQSFRVAQNCADTAFFAAHQDTSTLAVFSWKEGQNTPTQKAVAVARWIGGNGYVSRTADNRRWLDRADPRITGATMAKNELWFAWSVDRNSNHRPRPFIQIAHLDAKTLTLIDNVNVFNSTSATAYPALATNEDDEVGISYMVGGGPLNPSHAVGILTGTRRDQIVSNGDRGPLADEDTGQGEWGDYLTLRRAFPNEKLFAATGYTMKGPGDTTNRDCTPRFVVFGRSSDVSVIPVPGTTVPGPIVVTSPIIVPPVTEPVIPPPPPEVTPGQPFKNVNTLPVVNAAIAAQIKGAAMAEGLEATPLEFPIIGLELVTKPGVERWPVKTGTDVNVALVGKNIIADQSLGAGIVPATVEELILMGRPVGMRPATKNFDSGFHATRLGVVERTVWQIEGDITVVKLEKDGDYHLVVQGASGETMIAEVPTGTKVFVGDSPWLANIKAARQKIDDKLVKPLSPQNFVQLAGTLVPRDSLPPELAVHALPPPSAVLSFVTDANDSDVPMPTFKTKVKPTPARITGVGFFDRVHGQTGVSQFNGIELHPILKIEFI